MRSCRFLLISALFLGADPTFAQRGDTPGKSLAQDFAQAPRVGDELPDLIVCDAEGDEFSLRSLRGKPAVLVFGCLT